MNRAEFEEAYAEKYLDGDYMVARDNRDGEGYTDHHIDLCWKVQKAIDTANKSLFFNENARIRIRQMLEW